jgi:hypothetical protein
VWRVEDTCGNRRERTQNILIKNTIDNARWDFRQFLMFSFRTLTLSNAEIMGETSARGYISLNYSQIGHALDVASSPLAKCVAQAYVICFFRKY